MFSKVLISIGLRSQCCGAKIETWHAGKDLCSQCQKWIRKNIPAEAVASLKTKQTNPVLNLKRLK